MDQQCVSREEPPHPALLHYLLREYMSMPLSADRKEQAIKAVQMKLHGDFHADAYPLLEYLKESDRVSFLKALYDMAMQVPGACLPALNDPKMNEKLAELALLGFVKVSEPDGTGITSMRLRGYYPVLVLHWVNSDGTLRKDPFERDTSDPMILRLLSMNALIEEWMEQRDEKRLDAVEAGLKAVYERHGRILGSDDDDLKGWKQFVATLPKKKQNLFEGWAHKYRHARLHIAVSRQWRNLLVHWIARNDDLASVGNLLPPYINEIADVVRDVDSRFAANQ